MSWYVYLLRCADDSIYCGITKDLNRRLSEHNQDDKKGARYTRGRRPVKLIYQEQIVNRSMASQREHQLKKLNRKQKLALMHDQPRAMHE